MKVTPHNENSSAARQTIDLVTAGDDESALAATIDGVRRGRRVLVALRSGNARVARRFRRSVCRGANVHDGQLSVMTNVEVVCVDGVEGVEAIVIRHRQTCRLCALNASAFLST